MHKNIVSKTWVRISATNIFYSIYSKFDIICENVDIEYWFIKIQLTLNLPFYHLVKKKNPTTLESITLDVSIRCAAQWIILT